MFLEDQKENLEKSMTEQFKLGRMGEYLNQLKAYKEIVNLINLEKGNDFKRKSVEVKDDSNDKSLCKHIKRADSAYVDFDREEGTRIFHRGKLFRLPKGTKADEIVEMVLDIVDIRDCVIYVDGGFGYSDFLVSDLLVDTFQVAGVGVERIRRVKNK